MWAAETAPPCRGSLLHSGGSATAGSISRNRPRLLAAPDRLVVPLCLGAGGKTEQGPFGSINCPFGSVSLLPVWMQEKREFKTESARKLNPPQGIFSTSMTSLIQSSTQQLVGMLFHLTAEMLRVALHYCHLENLTCSPNYSLNKMVWPLPRT